jgi:hypothetical protein
VIDYIVRKRPDGAFPGFFTQLCLDMFAIVQYWQPSLQGIERGRMFERLLHRYCEDREVRLTERAGSRTLDGERAASGFNHEQDAVIVSPSLAVHLELKHLSAPLSKNELLVFNQKGLDYLLGGSEYFRKRPLYRMLLSGHVLCPEARRFAHQWGICVIEPDWLPLPVLHYLTNCGMTARSVSNPIDEAAARQAVRIAVCPVQEQIGRFFDIVVGGDQPTSKEHESWILNIVQREWGDAYWMALDDLSGGHWLEERYDALEHELALNAV